MKSARANVDHLSVFRVPTEFFQIFTVYKNLTNFRKTKWKLCNPSQASSGLQNWRRKEKEKKILPKNIRIPHTQRDTFLPLFVYIKTGVR